MVNDRIQILICDDDPISLGMNQKCVELYSRKFKKSVHLHCFSQVNEKLYQLIDSNQIDIAMLDIDLEKASGIELAKRLQVKNPTIPVIFVTSHSEYKAQACDILAVGYLTKPVYTEKFGILYQRALAQIDLKEKNEFESFVELYVNKKNMKIRISSIISIEKIQKKMRITTQKGIYEVTGTLRGMEEKLDDSFLKVSQSAIVNKHEIIALERNAVYLSTGDVFNIGRTFLKQVKAAYKDS